MKKAKEKEWVRLLIILINKGGVIKLSDVLSLGDEIVIKSKTEEKFRQKVSSMEIEGKKIKRAKKGQQIGLKMKKPAREGYLVFKT